MKELYSHLRSCIKEPGTFASISPVQRIGHAEDLRILIRSKTHSGPKAVMGRDAELVMNIEEAYALACSILRELPFLWVQENSGPIEQLHRMITAK